MLTHLVSGSMVLLGLTCQSPELSRFWVLVGGFALSAALTNGLALWLIFLKVPFCYGSGVLECQFSAIRESLMDTLDEVFLNEAAIDAQIQKMPCPLSGLGTLNLSPIAEAAYAHLVQTPMGQMLAVFGGSNLQPQAVSAIESTLQHVLDDTLPTEWQHSLSDESKRREISTRYQAQLRHAFADRLASFTPKELKAIIERLIRKHLSWLIVWGGVMGGLMGVVFFALT